MKDFKINIDFLACYKGKEEVKAEDFKESATFFSIFDANGDGKLSSNEIGDIFQKLLNSVEINTEDKRSNAYAILDKKEIEHFIENNKTKLGEIYKNLGVTSAEVLSFLTNLKNNAVEIAGGDIQLVEEENFSENTAVNQEIQEKAQKFVNIPEREQQQFSREECLLLSMLINGISKEVTAARAYYLQRYFPKTIALVAEKYNLALMGQHQ